MSYRRESISQLRSELKKLEAMRAALADSDRHAAEVTEGIWSIRYVLGIRKPVGSVRELPARGRNSGQLRAAR